MQGGVNLLQKKSLFVLLLAYAKSTALELVIEIPEPLLLELQVFKPVAYSCLGIISLCSGKLLRGELHVLFRLR
jgi:hypothetical protein